MAVSWPVLVIVLQAFITPAELICKIPEEKTRLIKSLNQKLLKATLDVSHEANPSVYIGLRLSEYHNLEKENEYLQRLKSSVETISSSVLNVNDGDSRTGLLALHLLAQKASCEDMDTQERNRLITHLKYHLHKEKENIVLNEKPLSNYYQYSLGILAMCVSDKMMDRHLIHKLVVAGKENQFAHGETKSIDTEAMAGLALLCLKKPNNYPRELIAQIKGAVKNIKDRILASQTTEGEFGNIYSTPLAVQFLSALNSKKDKDSCSKALSVLLDAIKHGKFSNPMMMSQIMPVLHHKSYLDVADMSCEDIIDSSLVISSSPNIQDVAISEQLIHVRLVVKDQKVDETMEVPSGSTLLNILEAACKQNPVFNYKTKNSLHGPYLTTVNDVDGDWKILKNPNIYLIEGIADYSPVDGEIITLKL